MIQQASLPEMKLKGDLKIAAASCESGCHVPSFQNATWTSKVPKLIARMPVVLGIKAIILGTLEVQVLRYGSL